MVRLCSIDVCSSKKRCPEDRQRWLGHLVEKRNKAACSNVEKRRAHVFQQLHSFMSFCFIFYEILGETFATTLILEDRTASSIKSPKEQTLD